MPHKSFADHLIFPIRIPTPFAVGDVFSYLIKDEKVVLVDTGHYADGAFECVSSRLQELGLSVKDLDEIWLTHGHPDHFGQAAKLSDRSGAVVYGHPQERANFMAHGDGELFEEFFEHHNVPDQLAHQMIEQLDWLQQYQLPIEPEWVRDGEVLSSGVLSATVHHTPGHAPGHVVYKTNREIIFGGDLLLGHISTNALINFDAETDRRNKSLLQYRDSLQWIRQQRSLVLPGHGEVIDNPKTIADHHLSEHQKRYKKIQQLLITKPMTLMELSQHIFPDAIKNGAIFLVLSEVLGYLDWGMSEDMIEVDESSMKYQIAK
ncbi:MAG: MBL fold metallo-hydrolase [Bacteroidota bacterium]